MSGATRSKASLKRTKHRTVRKQLKELENTTAADPAKRLEFAQEQLTEATSFIFVCLQVLQPGCSEVDPTEEILAVLGRAYVQLREDVEPALQEALTALVPNKHQRITRA